MRGYYKGALEHWQAVAGDEVVTSYEEGSPRTPRITTDHHRGHIGQRLMVAVAALFVAAFFAAAANVLVRRLPFTGKTTGKTTQVAELDYRTGDFEKPCDAKKNGAEGNPCKLSAFKPPPVHNKSSGLAVVPGAAFCADIGQDCKKLRCCKTAGMQCYQKDKYWAACRADCTPGPELTDVNGKPWNCKKLGVRTPGNAPKPIPIKVPDWVKSQCSAMGTDCRQSRCCKNSGMQCFEMDSKWATCKPVCVQGPDPANSSKVWSCNKLGSRTGAASWHSPSLFCFSIIQQTGYEPPLMRTQLKKRVGIFSCDEYAIFSSGHVLLGNDDFGPLRTNHFVNAHVGTSKDGTAGNAKLFMNAWDAVNKEGRMWNHNWILKVDPDAVLLPDRLRPHLAPHKGANMYIVNCDKPLMVPMMFGSLEVFSFEAMQTYFHGVEKCKTELDWQSWGEDYFMGHCLDFLGTDAVNDFTIISDGVCKGLSCVDPNAAVFHPLKSIESWMDCWGQASTIPGAVPMPV